MASYRSHQRHSTATKYEDENEDDDEKEVRPPSLKHRVNNDKHIIISKLATDRKRLCLHATRMQA